MALRLKKEKPQNYIRGVILGFRRSLRHQDVSKVRIKLQNVKNNSDSSLFLGKRVMYLQKSLTKKKRIVWGKITSLHGRSGSFLVKFMKNLPPSSITNPVYVTMFTSNQKNNKQ